MPKARRLRIRGKGKDFCPHSMALRCVQSRHIPKEFAWYEFLASAIKFRGRNFDWNTAPERSPEKRLLSWFKKTPALGEWLLSEQCLVSPKQWPKDVLPAFKHQLIPSPYELCNVNMHKLYLSDERDLANFFVVLLYGMGFDLEKIGEVYNMSENAVIHAMHDSLTALNRVPQYLIWATATDFQTALWFTGWQKYGLGQRMELLRTLNKNPFLLSDRDARLMVESSAYLAYLVYQSPKRPRLVRSGRLYRTSEAKHGT